MSGDPLGWAAGEAIRLKGVASSREIEDEVAYSSAVRHHAAAAMEFLRIHAGGTDFYNGIETNFTGTQIGPKAALLAVADLLERWIAYQQSGLAALVPFAAQARIEAATDLMEQVQFLLDDTQVIPAAPIMLAGAALEEFLRSMVAANPQATVAGKPGLNSYALALAASGLLTKQDVKDVTAMAGHRNDAAHGHFDLLSPERARLMADMVNLFIRQHTPS